MISTLNYLGCTKLWYVNGTFKMAVSSSEPHFLSVLRPLGISLNNGNFLSLNFKPLQMNVLDIIMLRGQDVIGGFFHESIKLGYKEFLVVRNTSVTGSNSWTDCNFPSQVNPTTKGTLKYVGYWPSVRSNSWIFHFFAYLWTETESRLNKLDQERTYYMEKDKYFLRGHSR